MTPLRCLWVTRFVPFPPFHGGDATYSRRLIEALAAAGAAVRVVCHANGGDGPPLVPGVDWTVVPFSERGRARSLLSSKPALTYRFSTPEIRAAFSALLVQGAWDAVLIDNLAMAGVMRRRPAKHPLDARTALVYVSHNHEESLRKQLAARAPRLSASGLALRLDASKSAALERTLVEAADLVTVNTEADAELFREASPNRRMLVLTPGYQGPVVQRRVIDDQCPRRVLLLGSYGWIAKQINVERFLSLAAQPLARASIGIDVVGSIPDDFAARLRADFPNVNVTGAVQDLGLYLTRARIGIVADEIGGGFKHKALDYVFSRVPIAALSGSVVGAPLVPDVSILQFNDIGQMVEGLVQTIDDFRRLNAIQEAAFQACTGQFEWSDRGRRLADELTTHRANAEVAFET